MISLQHMECPETNKRHTSVTLDSMLPEPRAREALIKVHRAGICATDLELTRGYVPGFAGTLGHEFVGTVTECPDKPELVGKRVVGEININCAGFSCADAVFQRNHAPGRQVLGIINRPGCFASYVRLPAANLHVVPEQLSDAEAAFAEPLAAACRVVEQGLVQSQPGATQRIAVVGDGRLGLLIAQVLALSAPGRVTHFGRHPCKMRLVSGTAECVLSTADAVQQHAAAFDLVVEASGSASSIRDALKLTKAMGTLVCKTTVSLEDPGQPVWAELANDVVVNEKTLVGSRCAPMDMALRMMTQHAEIRALLGAMVQHEVPLADGVRALELARQKGVLKVQLVMTP